MKRVGHLIEKIADLDNLLLAYSKASRGRQDKQEVRAFASGLSRNLEHMRQSLEAGIVDVGHYSYFPVYDPKPRLICAASFQERVLYHAIMNICHSVFERVLISDTYATRPGKGVYKAIGRAREFAKAYSVVGKFDFRKYFDSIDHGILKNKLRSLFKDSRLLSIFDQIVDSYCVKENKGIPIGNLTSQYFANHYLSSMDHYVKEDLRIKAYVRYMDDFLVFANSKAELDDWALKIDAYARDTLALELKPVVKAKVSHGVSFLGYRVCPHKLLLNARSKHRFSMKMKRYQEFLEQGLWDEQRYQAHILPLLAFVRHAYTKGLRGKMLGESWGHS